MADSFEIRDGNPIWASPSIIPSQTKPASTLTQPTWSDPLWVDPATGAPPAPTVDVYVRVENLTDVPIGCVTEVGVWSAPVAFDAANVRPANPTGDFSFPVHNGWTFKASTSGDSLSHATYGIFDLPGVTSGRKVFGWSPDGRFFALMRDAPGGNGTHWNLLVVALHGATDLLGNDIALFTAREFPQSPTSGLTTDSTQLSAAFQPADLGWIGGSGVFFKAKDAALQHDLRFVSCFRGTPSPTLSVLRDPFLNGRTWSYLASPCGASIAFVLAPTATLPGELTFISTVTAATASPQQSGGNVGAPTVTGPDVRITTVRHTALGVDVFTGTGAGSQTVTIDDPDATEQFGGVLVHVDRIRASTIFQPPSDVHRVGTAAAGKIDVKTSPTPTNPNPDDGYAWVQVPNQATEKWDPHGETHWCLLAQVYEGHVPWDGPNTTVMFDAASYPTRAQRNIHIG